jgi:hypothetical protein
MRQARFQKAAFPLLKKMRRQQEARFQARLDEHESAFANPYLMEQSKSRRRLSREQALRQAL